MYKRRFTQSGTILFTAVYNQRDFRWFELIFDLCSQVKTYPTEKHFQDALTSKCFDKLSKQCQSIIKENYNKYYPK